MHHASGMMSGPVANQSGISCSFSSNIMDETDDYMDYVGGGGSPLGLSSESSNQDRSCTSTPVGNDSSPAGEKMLKKKKAKNKRSMESFYMVLSVKGGFVSYTMLGPLHTHPLHPKTQQGVIQHVLELSSLIFYHNEQTHSTRYILMF